MKHVVLAAFALSGALPLVGACQDNQLGAEPCAGPTCACEGDAPCQLACEGPGCSFACPPNGQCGFFCDEGGCDVTCDQSSHCELDCPGGGCTLRCVGSGTCVLHRCRDVTPACATECDEGARCIDDENL